MVQEGVGASYALRRELIYEGADVPMAEGLLFGSRFILSWAASPAGGCIGLHAGSAAPYIFPNACTSCQLSEGETSARD